MARRTIAPWVLLAEAALVAAFGVALRAGAFPLGVRGEWEWLRVPAPPAAFDVALAALGVAAYAGFAGVGLRALEGAVSRRREAAWLAGLVVAAAMVQGVVTWGAPLGYGLVKWALALHGPGSNGYYTVARREVRDPWRFLAEYPRWIKTQDALHVGTHPPGLFLTAHALLRTMEDHPTVARAVVDNVPGTVAVAFAAIAQDEPLPRADRATLALTGALTLLACAATVVPLYLLARASLSAPASWASAALWPLVPSAVLFQPAADTAFPLLATTALALAAHAGRRGTLLAGAAGVVLALGMAFSLVFVPVGLVVALILMGAPARRAVALIVATGAGFLAVTLAFWAATGADPFVIWWWNQRNHARFYVEYPRTYRAWVLINPVELSVALGLPAMVWAALGLPAFRSVPRVAWATLAVLVVLSFSGRSLSEVARLWLPLMPPLLMAAGVGLTRLGGGAKTLAMTVALMGAEVLILEGMIQVVYPV